MMCADPFRMVVVPPAAVVPYVMLVPVAVDGAPIGVNLDPFGMMMPDPTGVMFVPPDRVVPYVMVIPITVISRVRDRRRSREDRSQGSGGEDRSKFHSCYLLDRSRE